ncbi:DUF4148 domain-containing protein [Paraburkholderia guartelaensis]|uniref:DUF4148 domain-containing protein n=1 Tax=Paraburkholderia guartelaensis TaxID=2546446 RepID=A0A4R5L7Y9_9BURK|nr:DUF4148 domain-containing protein [Paraburkholderia guartelaensis]TDG04007.1 DUF4148 domain-containing protein [Paraburkholderia guartelaensis]
MKTMISAGILFALIGSAVVNYASAQEATRAEVRQELVQAQGNDSPNITDTSDPATDPISTKQVAQLQTRSNSSSGANMSSVRETTHHTDCVGPASFCSIYFGS